MLRTEGLGSTQDLLTSLCNCSNSYLPLGATRLWHSFSWSVRQHSICQHYERSYTRRKSVTRTHNLLTALGPGLPGYRPVPEETFSHSHLSWSSVILYQLTPFTTIHSILFIQFTCLTVLFDNLSPAPLWSSCWSYTILHTPCISSPSHHHLFAVGPTCPYRSSLFCCNTNATSSIPNLSLSSLLGNLSFSLMPHIHLTILISAHWSAITFSFLVGQISLPCNMLLRTELLYNLPLIINDTSLLVSTGTNCLNLFQPIRCVWFYSYRLSCLYFPHYLSIH